MESRQSSKAVNTYLFRIEIDYECAKAPDQIWEASLMIDSTTGDESNSLVPASRDAALCTNRLMAQLLSCALPRLHVDLLMRYLTRTEMMSVGSCGLAR